MRLIFLLVLLTSNLILKAENRAVRFERIDSLARKVNSKSLDSVVFDLTKTCKSEVAKVRAIFVWITEHIAYDVGALNRKRMIRQFSYVDSKDSLLKEQLILSNRADSAFRKRKAVCEGYAFLLKKMLDQSNIRSEIVYGFARTSTSDSQLNSDSSNHAWNAVWLDNKWYLLDATWASGYVNSSNSKYTKEYNDAFFLAKPSLLLHSHYPQDNKWQLIEKPISRDSFFNQLFTTSAYAQEGIISIKPSEAFLQVSATNPLISIQVEHEESSSFLSLEQFPKPNKKKGNHVDLRESFIEKLNPKEERYFTIQTKILPRTTTLDVVFNMVVVATYKIKWIDSE